MKSLSVTFLFMIFLFTSCASFSDKMIKNDKTALTKNDLSRLEGTYELFADVKYYEKGNVAKVDSDDVKQYSNLNRFLKDSKTEYNLKEKYSVEIKLVNLNKIKFITLKDNVKTDSIELGGKLKKGLFYLDNKYLKRNGVPYLAGGYTNYKTRIGLSKDNNLIVNYAYDNSGALLFFIWAGSSYNSAYQYKRVERNE
ncbi:hypothetical protein [Flavobacterium olei]|uniref:hypothetical protein n=1 Tax=Flavobacterium olei TaxID=1886782 RepID=UPI00321AFECC